MTSRLAAVPRARRRSVRLDRQHGGQRRRRRRPRRASGAVSCPGKNAGKLAQALSGARVIALRGNFDQALTRPASWSRRPTRS